MKSISVVLFLLMFSVGGGLGAPGDLDPTFGSGGKLYATVPNFNPAHGVTLQPDGKILLAGITLGPDNTQDFAVVRLNADGTTDTSFGANGLVGIPFDNFANEAAIAVAMQPDGKIVVAGSVQFGSPSWDFGIARLNSNGTIDTSFSGGKVKVNIGGEDFVSSLVLQPDGKIVLTGSSRPTPNTDVPVVRLTATGALDLSFNGTGKVLLAVGSGNNDGGNALILQPDGKIVVAGSTRTSMRGFFLLFRVNPNGVLDTSFGTLGVVQTAVGQQFDQANSAALQDDGKIIAAGTTNSGSPDQAAFVRYNPDGSLDNTFGNDGKVSIDVRPMHSDVIRSVLLQSDAKVVGVGASGGSYILVRLNSNGSIDSGFGTAGKVVANVAPDTSAANNAVLQPDGKIVAVGDGSGNATFGFTAARFSTASTARRFFDYDGDGRSDISVFRPSNGVWYVQNSSGNPAYSINAFGVSSDSIAPADFDGDGKTDLAVFRESNGYWYLNRSTAGFTAVGFGLSGDKPVAADYDGDGKADVAVFRPSSGTWWISRSSDGGVSGTQFGTSEDIPTIGDFDGDGKADVAIYRPSNGVWYRLNSGNGQFVAVQFGTTGDKPTAADFDGDGKTDVAVFRPSNGVWYILGSTAGFSATAFGTSGDKPVAADYDGDGKSDVAVFRPSNGTWYLLRSTAGFSAQQFGTSEDRPTPNAFVP